jgi:hypothetical protein
MNTLRHFLHATRRTVTDLRALGILVALYALLLVSFYIFVSTREATVWQVLITYLFLVLVPAEFFVLQAAILCHAREKKFHWSQIVRDAIKLVVITIPIILLGWALWALLNRWQLHYQAPTPPITFGTTPPKTQPMHWPTTLFATLRFLLFGIAYPLTTIHLWIEVTGRDLKALVSGGAEATVKRIGSVLSRAFASDSVFKYALGLVLFVFIPYALLFVPITIKGTKTAFAVFILRLVIAFASILIGWVVTLTTLTRSTEATLAIPAGPIQETPAEAAA